MDLKPGERKVISDGGSGPVVEIIRRSATETEAPALAEPAGGLEQGTTGER
jgi:hypothetical protein